MKTEQPEAANHSTPVVGSGPLLAALACLLILVVGILPPLLRSAPSDTAWLLYLTEWTTRGGTYGLDFIEVSPPLILWLSLPPTALGAAVGVPVWPLMVLWCAVLGVLSLALQAKAMALFPKGSRDGLVLLVGSVVVVSLLPLEDFGQREHFALILTIPYVFLGAKRAMGAQPSTPLALSIGLFAGCGFALKPYFLVPLVFLELYLWWRLRDRTFRRVEAWMVAGFGASYVTLVVVITPSYAGMAAHLRPWYASYLDAGALETLSRAGPVLLLSLVALAAHAVVRKADDPLAASLGLTAFGFLAAALIQAKGFRYHFLPASGFALLALVRCWQVVPKRLSWYPSAWLVRGSLGLLAYVPLASSWSVARELSIGAAPVDPAYDQLLPVVGAAGRNAPVAVLSSNLGSSWPLLSDAKVRTGIRYPSLWPLAAVYHSQLQFETGQLIIPNAEDARTDFERAFVQQIVADLIDSRPSRLLALSPDPGTPGWGGARRFDYLAYFGSDQKFRAFLQSYRETEAIGMYRVFVRLE